MIFLPKDIMICLDEPVSAECVEKAEVPPLLSFSLGFSHKPNQKRQKSAIQLSD